MSNETWRMMVQVAKQKLDAANEKVTPRVRRKRTSLHRLFRPCVREDHYALLIAAGY